MKKRNPKYLVFFIFLLTNSLLSYGTWALGARLGISLLGLVLPFLWIWRKSPQPMAPPQDREFLPVIPPWGWFLLGLAAVAARFTFLTSLFVWPNFDEGTSGIEALHLSEKWSWRMFYGDSQAPPLYFWGLALFFKVFGASLKNLWFFSALISLLAVPLAYLVARTYFTRSFSFLCVFLTALSFWPLFVGRFAFMTGLLLPAEFLAFWLLGRFLKAHRGGERELSFLLALCLGLGFYVHLHWPIVVAIVGLPLLTWGLQHKGRAWKIIPPALGIFGLVLVPLAVAAYHENFGHYFYHLWAFKPDFSLAHQLPIWLSYLTAPFWGMDPNVKTYQPVWGGFLNPVLASLFFLGMGEMAGHWKRPLYQWLVAALGICYLPSLVTQDQETFRLFPIFPVVAVTALLGLSRLMSFKPAKNLVLVVPLLALSVGLDARHLYTYHRLWDDSRVWGGYSKSLGRYRAYQILKDQEKADGPGLVFPDFVQGLTDQSLTVATYGFNALLNPSLDFFSAHWAAVLVNVNYQPFLKKRFPEGKTYWLFKGDNVSDGGWMLFLFNVTPARLEMLKGWQRAQQALKPFLQLGLAYVYGQPFDSLLEALQKANPDFEGDLFLRACYWEKVADISLKQDFLMRQQGALLAPEKDPAFRNLCNAITEGYPAAHLYEHLGVLWLMRQNPPEARKAFQKALQAPLNLTDAAQYFSNLNRKRSSERVP